MPENTRDEVRTVDITPVLPYSPVVQQVKRFIERMFWYADKMERDDNTKAFLAFLDGQKRLTVKAMSEILADDAILMITGKLPSDRDRMIGTKRNIL